MIKYIIISANNPRIDLGIAELNVLCCERGQLYWEKVNKQNRNNWLKFDERESAELQALAYQNYWVYGIQEEE